MTYERGLKGDLDKYSNWLQLYLISPLVNLLDELGQIMARFDFLEFICDFEQCSNWLQTLPNFIFGQFYVARKHDCKAGAAVQRYRAGSEDHWVAGSNPPGGMFHHYFHLIVCLAQFSLNNVHKRGIKQHNFHFPWWLHTSSTQITQAGPLICPVIC